MINWLKNLNISKHFKKRRIGVDLFNRRLIAVESGKGIFIKKTIDEIFVEIPDKKRYKKLKKGILSDDYWRNPDVLNYLMGYWMKKAKLNSEHYYLFTVLPYKNFDSIYEKRDKAFLKTKKTNLCRAIGTFNDLQCICWYYGLVDTNEEKDYKKSWFLFSINKGFYLGYTFTGRVVDAVYIKDKYKELTSSDIKKEMEKLANFISEDIPQMFKDRELYTDEQIEKMTKEWAKPFGKTSYFSVPEELKKRFGEKIDKYSIKYLNYDEFSVIKGLEKIMTMVKV
ncbi:hypothetical protein RBH29_08135 [Herbivorax sp. ANBcel31]|uniref:hypothetical protein n=1 Tax=Herbivorax sp. ANBcel31 TaxID=3069754 RepID=UPI0027AE38DA|nr:hypothetical protein [Herbivorax sp. ANBcel31]MDQ2086397.1 hypothetical protein [Herbivorax sp. ANBcel31]